jgi:hypothetical protein
MTGWHQRIDSHGRAEKSLPTGGWRQWEILKDSVER